ncbi:hypothetical protein [Flavilitoribacter nigricans]|uniref:Uncharacterized protein n=1 Tax=Flavilitoribacter nigricans (strain ATCC 23147 / DSM 23189 / NBRC 102662 / NCIMB 1420 / SS-2) TaxID=1122177 RepID=A0A2D0N3Z2_FLAN2|nr:hypothetical protein [Flavilitoribacter nigricans]PHN03110.1 hypothetical protein CRP01_28950 [Flavilitoribacter nigricans DSM 23189 = NBRC 102662]
MNAKAIFLFSLALVFIGFSPLRGQSLEDSLYNGLDRTILIVRLPSQEKKMQAIKATIADPELSESARARLQAQLESVQMETKLKNLAILEAFDENFDAMPIGFVYDTTRNVYRTDLLNRQLEVTESVDIPGKVIQLRFGRPVLYSGSRAESMVLTDSELTDLGHPFPKPVLMTGFGYGFNKILAPETAFEKLLEKRVKKLNRKLEELFL